MSNDDWRADEELNWLSDADLSGVDSDEASRQFCSAFLPRGILMAFSTTLECCGFSPCLSSCPRALHSARKAEKLAQQQILAERRVLEKPIQNILRQYRAVVSYRKPVVYVQDTVRIALEVPSRAHDIIGNALLLVRPLAQQAHAPVRELRMFLAEHDWLPVRDGWQRDVREMYFTLELLEDIVDRATQMLDRHRLELGFRIVPYYQGRGPVPWAVLLHDGIAKHAFHYLHPE
ncbi:hypothetical protein BDZ89DRAFT_1145020 [Hymenopellis radicata]|nr:hypothetical protein BDZ89DRAFT_1146738 [Hymenopellis radicata]KAF9005809.1 hypothetical protein BDZ89DRAFT_1145020 [Hymenopellis radicata]